MVKTRKYKMNCWNVAVLKVDGKYQYMDIFPYKKKGKIIYKKRIHKQQKLNGNRKNDTAACNHSDLLNEVFENKIQEDGVDLPESNTELKETRQNKYWVSPKDAAADQIVFYNHDTEQFKDVKMDDYEEIMGPLDHIQTPTENQVQQMTGFETKSHQAIRKYVKK